MRYQTITYGNETEFTFPYTTLDVQQEAVYASDGIQIEGTRYTFHVRGTIVGNSVADFQTKICSMRRYLSTPRLRFVVRWTDENNVSTSLYDFTAVNDDDDWGPRPGPLRLHRFSGGIAASYEWSVTTMSKECYAAGCNLFAPTSEILSLVTRWDHQVDGASGLTTRTFSGKLTISSETITNAGKRKTADSYRWFMYPPVPVNFQVTHEQFSTSEDGRVLTGTVTCSEKNYVLPLPITGGDASFTIRLADAGLLAYFSLSGYFEAPRTVDKVAILAQIGDLLNSKLGQYFSGSNPVIFENQELTNSQMYEKNRIDFAFSGTFAVGGSSGAITPNFYAGLKQTLVQAPPSQANGVGNNVGPYGGDFPFTSGVVASRPLYLHDACNSTNDQLSLDQTSIVGAEKSSGQPPAPVPAGTVPADGAGSSVDHLNTPYIAYHEEVHYMLDNGVVVFEPKRANTPPVVQQARPPKMTVIQAGYSVRYARRVADVKHGVPDPIGTAKSRVVLTADVIPSAPDPIGDGTFSRFTTHWRYVMVVLAAYTNSENVGLEINYPKDPRRINSTSSTVSGAVDYTKGSLIIDPTKPVPVAAKQ